MSTQVSKNIFSLTASRMVALVLLFFAYRELFPYLGTEGTGQYQFILSYVLIFSIIVDFGIQQFITKKISGNPGETKQYFLEFFSFEVVVAGVLYLLLLVIALLQHYDRVILYGVALAGLGMVFNALTYPYLAVMAAFQDLRKVAWINFLNSCVNIAIIFLAIIFHRYVVFLAATQLVFGILGLILYRFLVRRHIADLSIVKNLNLFDFHLIKNILRQGWPFALLVGFSALYNRIDIIIITYLKGYEQTGLYSAAYKIFDLLGFFPSVVSFTLFPFFTSLMSKGAVAEVKVNLEKYLKLMLMAALPMAVGGMILSRKLIMLMTHSDPRFAGSAGVLAILIWAPAILFVYIPLNSLVLSQLTKKAMVITGANVVINSVGNLLLIPHFGIKAAAAMTVVSESLQGIFYFYFVRKNITNFNFLTSAIKPLAAAAIMGAVLWPIRDRQLFISLPVGAAVYFFALFISGFVKKEDLAVLKNLFRPSSAS